MSSSSRGLRRESARLDTCKSSGLNNNSYRRSPDLTLNYSETHLHVSLSSSILLCERSKKDVTQSSLNSRRKRCAGVQSKSE
jgi:hypothetical protein